MSEILSEVRGQIGIITINRPQALNALNTPMCEAITDALIKWRHDNNIKAVIIKSDETGRAFCAGGDVIMMSESGKAGDKRAETFWRTEYALNELIKTYQKPYIALIDGITMGGGVGLSVHGKYRIAGDKTLFAMPETGIGYFPDVGGTYFLPRLGTAIGNWMGLCGARLDGAMALKIGVATHFVKSENYAILLDALVENPGDIENTILQFATIPTCDDLPVEINLFAQESLEKVFHALENSQSDWVKAQLKILKTKSLFALNFTFAAMKIGMISDFKTAMNNELNWSLSFLSTPDFHEGIRAQLIDKDRNPQWMKSFTQDDVTRIIEKTDKVLEFIK